MSACNFTIDITGDPQTLVEKLRSKVQAQGGKFSGDDKGGTISVSVMTSTISGSYTIIGQQINIVIDNKPFLISCNQIKGFLAGNL